ncbi:hypothetical protein ACTXT7_016330 [Hymenolepis weldensis]
MYFADNSGYKPKVKLGNMCIILGVIQCLAELDQGPTRQVREYEKETRVRKTSDRQLGRPVVALFIKNIAYTFSQRQPIPHKLSSENVDLTATENEELRAAAFLSPFT